MYINEQLKKTNAQIAHLQFAQANPQAKIAKELFFSSPQRQILRNDCYFWTNNVLNKFSRTEKEMTAKESFGEHIRALRELQGLPLRKVAAVLDIDPSTLSKIERGERTANKEMLPLLADLFNESEEELGLILMSDKVAYDLMKEKNPDQILKVAEEKIQYLKEKNLRQGSLDF